MARAFSSDDIPVKKSDYHGFATYVRTSPDIAANGVKSVNVEMTFEEAMRFSVAMQSALMNLNRYSRSTTKGKNMGLCLSLLTKTNTISVIEIAVKPQKSAE